MDNQPLAEAMEDIIQQGALELPMLPAVANQVIQLTMNPESSSEQLAELLQRDQALAGHAMRIANSAAYSPVNKMDSLQQAITRLGMRSIAEIALASTLSAKLFKVPGYEWRAIEIWKHSLATALWSKEIARLLRLGTEATFLAGLLHSIGRPVVLQAALKLTDSLGVDPMPNLVLQLEDHYQQQVGLKVCQEWQMPTLVIDTISQLENSEAANRSKDPVTVIRAATLFAQLTVTPELMDQEQLRSHQVMEQLGLSEDQLDELLEKAEALEGTLATIAG
ncbi:HDOD domain-containing protein [Porticoccus sp. W117]|uniref:HDOD domain-containing protein n=1 Tax=Porticoccus sp. W117 TaxID=3054777 RepID=UPI002592152E|nr:HDOD domain-containing protein [Porticoccus sp. W117]MDM3870470.1 HDOD domain-containing protein [Porticoccus sp. W117]